MSNEAFDYLPTGSPRQAGGHETHAIEVEIDRSAMTDGGGTAGTYDLAEQLPKGAIPLGWTAEVLTAFSGNASAVIQVGTAADPDRFSADTAQSVFAAGLVGSAVIAADALKGVGAAQTIRVTITSGTDFTAVSAGKLKLRLFYTRTR